jgi:hypothetical protein
LIASALVKCRSKPNNSIAHLAIQPVALRLRNTRPKENEVKSMMWCDSK